MLQVKLIDAIDDSNLVQLGHFRVKVQKSDDAITTASNVIKFDASRDSNVVVRIVGDGHFVQSDMTTVIPGTELSATTIYLSDGDYELDVDMKYTIRRIELGSNLYMGTEQNGSYTSLEVFKSENSKTKITLETLATSGSLSNILVNNSGVSGSLESLKSKRYLVIVNAAGSAIEGDVSSLGDNTSVTTINVANSAVDGNIEHLGKLVRLDYLNVQGTSCVGSVDALAQAMKLNGRTSGALVFGSPDGTWKQINFPMT